MCAPRDSFTKDRAFGLQLLLDKQIFVEYLLYCNHCENLGRQRCGEEIQAKAKSQKGKNMFKKQK